MHSKTAPSTVLRRTRVAIVEDHSLQRERTAEILTERAGMRIVCSCEELPQFMAWLRNADPTERPNLLILDLSVDRGPSVDPQTVSSVVRGGIRVVVFSAMASPALVRQVLRTGVSGFVGKRDSAEDLIMAVRTALQGGMWTTPEMANVIVNDPTRPSLSDQEERALMLYAAGLTIDSVALRIGVKKDTAKKYIDRVKDKYAAVGRPARSKTELYRVAVADGFLDPPS